MKPFSSSVLGAVLLAGCHSPAMFPAVPDNLDRTSVPHQVIEMTARALKDKMTDDLFARKVISKAEHAAARAAILSS